MLARTLGTVWVVPARALPLECSILYDVAISLAFVRNEFEFFAVRCLSIASCGSSSNHASCFIDRWQKCRDQPRCDSPWSSAHSARPSVTTGFLRR